ncbi:PPR repeat protein [Plasmodium ovale wallikeri]|uniref:PPR repeat protein n=2 Tax=Plasmodium ovale TaxID=36330 RepID=A0A1A8ZT30_PLAOA|nr:PPR repeat protein [Plasmodium ovale wallikeri]SBT47030.1 PPR repeat protein [Plasmodium ovale wallikeri]SBT79002.1 pentatricopeptide repeat domain-containing protein, putative [Plasmodium ovale]
MKIKYCYYAFYIIKTILCVRPKGGRNDAIVLSYLPNNLFLTKDRKKKKINPIGLFDIVNGKKDTLTKRSNFFCTHLFRGEEEKNGTTDGCKNEDNKPDNMEEVPSEDILKKKGEGKEVEHSLFPLNMDWIKVMNLIHASNDVNATTLAFNAALAAVEKKGCLITMIELFEIMKSKNIKPDLISYKLILSICNKYHLAEHAEILFDQMIETDGLKPNYEIYSIMISCFSKIGNGYKAIEFLEKLRNDPFIENIKSIHTNYNNEKIKKWEKIFSEREIIQQQDIISNENKYKKEFHEINQKIKNIEKENSKIQYGEYANVIFACNISNLHEQGIKYFEELLTSGKYIPSTFIFENIFDLLSKNGNYKKCLQYYNKLKDDPNLKKNLNVNILNNIIKALSVHNKINIIEDIWNNEYDELLLTPNILSYHIMLNVYSNVDDYEKAFKMFKEMQMKKLLSANNILPFLYTINAFKNCGIYNYAIYVLRVAKYLALSGVHLLMLYNNAMISCVNAKKYDVIISLYAELITMQEKDPSFQININTLALVLLAFKELDMKEDFTRLKDLIIQKNYKLTPLCSKLISSTHNS